MFLILNIRLISVGVVFFKIIFSIVLALLLFLRAICCNKAALVSFIENIVSEKDSELISFDPRPFWHVVDVSGLNLFQCLRGAS